MNIVVNQYTSGEELSFDALSWNMKAVIVYKASSRVCGGYTELFKIPEYQYYN